MFILALILYVLTVDSCQNASGQMQGKLETHIQKLRVLLASL